MNIFAKKKKYALGIDLNLRARPFYLVDVGSFYATHGNRQKVNKNIP